MTSAPDSRDRRSLVFDAVVIRDGEQVLLETDRVVSAGAVVVVSGRNGSHVTAVLDLIIRHLTGEPSAAVLAGLRSSGRVHAEGFADVKRCEVAVMTREHALIGGLTAAENVALGPLAFGPAQSDEQIDAALDAVGLPAAVRDNLVEQLSGGQQQRVALARALVVDALVTVIDDPTSELDPASREKVHDAITAAAARGGIVIVGSPGSEQGPVADVRLRITGHGGRHVA